MELGSKCLELLRVWAGLYFTLPAWLFQGRRKGPELAAQGLLPPAGSRKEQTIPSFG